jgi:hypothetical protein
MNGIVSFGLFEGIVAMASTRNQAILKPAHGVLDTVPFFDQSMKDGPFEPSDVTFVDSQ